MPLPVVENAMRVKLRAILYDTGVPTEEAVFGFQGVNVHIFGGGLDWQDACQRVADGVRDAWNTKITSKGLWSTAVEMSSVTVDHLEAATGKTLHQAASSFGTPTTWYGSGNSSLPWETALVVSLFGYEKGTFTPNKGRKRGRFYLPPMDATVLSGQTGECNNSAIDALTTQMGNFLNDVQGINTNDPIGQDNDYFDLRVLSRGTVDEPLTPTSTPITHFYIDSKIDSQRRRERQQPAKRTGSGTIAHA